MKPVYFVICFSTGVCLMIFSGYVPQSASARNSPAADSRGFTAAAGPEQAAPAGRPHSGNPVYTPGAAAVAREPENPAGLPTETPGQPENANPAPPSVSERGTESADPAPGELPPLHAHATAPQIGAPQTGPPEVADTTTTPHGQTDTNRPSAVSTTDEADAQPASPDPTPQRPRGRRGRRAQDGPGPDEPAAPFANDSAPRPRSDRNGDEAAAPKQEPAGPAARVAKGGVVWSGWDALALDGSASTGGGNAGTVSAGNGADGKHLTYAWRQTGGPPLVILDPTSAVTSVTGLAALRPSWRSSICKFELTVTDANGAHDTAGVVYTVRFAPPLRTRPAAERSFEDRDGYQLPHFVIWQTNYDGLAATFEVASDSELTFERLAGGGYAVSGGRTDLGWVYQIAVYPVSGEAQSWLEFLVNTEEKIPAVLQLGVNWDVRPEAPPALPQTEGA